MLVHSELADPFDRIKPLAVAFIERLQACRGKTTPKQGPWYPYNSVSNVWNLDKTLTGGNRRIFDGLAGKKIADIGAADGDFGFFLETLGAEVELIDNPHTSINNFTGAAALKTQLSARARLHSIDLDDQFLLPQRYDLALVLGILYHLKNPFYVMEKIARHAKHALLSTRVAAYAEPATQGKRTLIENMPMAYLLDALEANSDATNFWIFSNAGLRRLLHRTSWDILDYKVLGVDAEHSDPFTAQGDQRAFCLLRSRHF